MELISREAAIEAIEELKNRYFDRKVVLAKAQDAVNNLPTISPKRGKWIEQSHDDWKYSKEFRCSECGKFRLVTNPVGWEWHYCPNCGARMEGEEDAD